MHLRSIALPMMALAFLMLAGCDTGEETTGPKASDFNGTWRGTYTLSGGQSAADVPFELYNVFGRDDDGLVAGTLESEHVTGAFAGTMDESGIVTGEIENEVDGEIWTASLTMNDDGIQMDLALDGLVVVGQGAAGAPANKVGYKSTVTNRTDETVSILRLFVLDIRCLEKGLDAPDLAPGESYTFETGLLCPIGFDKFATALEGWSFPDTSCQGDNKPHHDWFWCCCRSSSWEVRPIPSTQNGITYPNTLVRL